MKAFDLRPIIHNFYRGILDDPSRPDYEAYVLIFAPAVFALVAMIRHLDANFTGTMATALAILFGFTFSTLMSTARYSAKQDPIEEKLVNQTRVGTAYALLVNLLSLTVLVLVSILVTDYSALTYPVATVASAVVYFCMFHYLLVMIYMMRYLYLLAIGGAFEEPTDTSPSQDEESESEASETTI